jgi:CDP-diacylglycerol---serine O-phosphatidyltransferase
MSQPRVFAVLPTLLTLGNAVCGFGAITFAAKVGLPHHVGWGRDDSECLFIAGILVFLAMLFDMLDGRAARWANQSSQFGAELDSLCDAISFGVAPAIILVKFTPDFHPRLLWAIAGFYVVCAVLRLARFNVETDDDDSHESFSGLPSPAAAGTVVSFMIAYPELVYRAGPLAPNADWWTRWLHLGAVEAIPFIKIALPIVTLTVACLMVSRIHYPHVFNQVFRGKQPFSRLIQLVVGIAVCVVIQELAIPLAFTWFALSGPFRAVWRFVTGKQGDDASPPTINPNASGIPA